MSLSDIGVILSMVASVLAMIGTIYAIAFKLAKMESQIQFREDSLKYIDALPERFGRIEVKVDTIWDFQMKRALAESLHTGIAKMNSPLMFNPETKLWLKDIATDLRAFYRSIGRTMTNNDITLEIERRWGDDLVRKICIPYKTHLGACLLLAAAIAKSEDDVDIILLDI